MHYFQKPCEKTNKTRTASRIPIEVELLFEFNTAGIVLNKRNIEDQ